MQRKARLLYASGSRWTAELIEGQPNHKVLVSDENLAKAVKHMWLAELSLEQIKSMLDKTEKLWQLG